MTDASTRRSLPVRDLGHPVLVAIVGVACAATVIARFVIPSALWLDEALSVNIARLPIHEIPDALRRDGHPPLYYVLLHVWMGWFGEGDRAVRALSGLISIATIPPAYLAGRRLGGQRLGWLTVIVLCLSPYFLRYGSEARMYSLVILLTTLGYLVATSALKDPRPGPLLGVAVTTGALLWTHYWSIWLLVAVALLLVTLIVRRRADRSARRPALLVLGAMAVGGLAFLPWLPTFLYQVQHTGTPWAKPLRPATVVVQTLTDFNGGPYSEPQLLMVMSIVLLTIGVFGRGIDAWRVELDFHTQPDARRPVAVLATTLVIGSVVVSVSRGGFHSRYAAVVFVFFVLLIALGLDHVRGSVTRNLALGLFLVLSLAGLFLVFRLERTQARAVAEAIAREDRPDAIVAVCPDQLGPAVRRAVNPKIEVVTYPNLGNPTFVDWVDYAERNRRNDPAAFAAALINRAGGRTIYLALVNNYRTLEGQCANALAALAQSRTARPLLEAKAGDYYEAMSLYALDPP
jgi:mannosyltransferase